MGKNMFFVAREWKTKLKGLDKTNITRRFLRFIFFSFLYKPVELPDAKN